MSTCTAGTCPHDQEAFVWLGDGPWAGDPADPGYRRFPWVRATALIPFVMPERRKAGEAA